SRAAISVEPTRSQNSNVRCRRSPPALALALGTLTVGASSTAEWTTRAAPQSPQNLNEAMFSARIADTSRTAGTHIRPRIYSQPDFQLRASSSASAHSPCVNLTAVRMLDHVCLASSLVRFEQVDV